MTRNPIKANYAYNIEDRLLTPQKFETMKTLGHFAQAIGKDNYIELMTSIISSLDKEISIISIGCGTGRLENILKHNLQDIKFFGIDPDPMSHNTDNEIFFESSRTLEELFELHPFLIDSPKCLLFHWPTPMNKWDMAYILKMKPEYVLTYSDRSGGAGSSELNEFMYQSPETNGHDHNVAFTSRIGGGCGDNQYLYVKLIKVNHDFLNWFILNNGGNFETFEEETSETFEEETSEAFLEEKIEELNI